MIIEFKTKKLQKQFEDDKEAYKAYGKKIGRKYIQRIQIIQQAKNINDLIGKPVLHCHQLKGSREGQWAINLDNFHRLIFTLKGNCLEIVRIEEVSKHYDD